MGNLYLERQYQYILSLIDRKQKGESVNTEHYLFAVNDLERVKRLLGY